MKKLLFFAAMIAAITFTSCGNGVNKLPKELREIIKEMDKDYKKALSGDDEPYIYKGVSVEDKDVIFTFQVNEDLLDEMGAKSLKELSKEFGGKEALAFTLSERVDEVAGIEEDEDEDIKLIRLLVKHKYNAVIRFIGVDEDDVVEGKISYKEMKQLLDE